ncbi:hypothetical protein CR513_32382, partial [Mucuna pruriens]
VVLKVTHLTLRIVVSVIIVIVRNIPLIDVGNYMLHTLVIHLLAYLNLVLPTTRFLTLVYLTTFLVINPFSRPYLHLVVYLIIVMFRGPYCIVISYGSKYFFYHEIKTHFGVFICSPCSDMSICLNHFNNLWRPKTFFTKNHVPRAFNKMGPPSTKIDISLTYLTPLFLKGHVLPHF